MMVSGSGGSPVPVHILWKSLTHYSAGGGVECSPDGLSLWGLEQRWKNPVPTDSIIIPRCIPSGNPLCAAMSRCAARARPRTR